MKVSEVEIRIPALCLSYPRLPIGFAHRVGQVRFPSLTMSGRWHKLYHADIEKHGYTMSLLIVIARALNPSASIRQLASMTGAAKSHIHRIIVEPGTVEGTVEGTPESPETEASRQIVGQLRGQLRGQSSRAHAVVAFGSCIEGKATTTTETTRPPLPPKGAGRRSRTPAPNLEDFQITNEMRGWFRKNFGAIASSLVLSETAAFLDHHRAKGNLMADWPSAWRTWMRNWRTKYSGASPGVPRESEADRKSREYKAYLKDKYGEPEDGDAGDGGAERPVQGAGRT
jgi:hypothetical protein